MNVSISVFGNYHAFQLAHQLDEHGALAQLITTYPKFKAVRHGVPSDKIDSLLVHQLLFQGWNRSPQILQRTINLQYWRHERFDRAASKRIADDIDLYVGWSSFSEYGLAHARERGAITIVERGSAHIEYQRDILREEYERLGVYAQLPHPEIVEKERREYEMADYISVASTFVERTFIEKGFPPAKLIKVPLGVDLAHFSPLLRRDEVFRVIFAGTMSLQKGVHYLLQAFSELHLPNAELWLVGDQLPEIVPFFNKYAGTFRYFGHVAQTQLREYYSQCSVFTICSIQDGFGVVVPQAMACGLPIICTTNTGGGDIVDDGKTGFVIPIRDVDALKEKLLYLYEHRDTCSEMGQAARRKVQRGLSWDDYGRKMYAEYQRILGSTGPRDDD